MAVEGGVGAGRVELYGVKALLDVEQRRIRPPCRDRCRRSSPAASSVWTLPVCRVEIGVGAQLLVHLAAEQLVDRLVPLPCR